MADTEDDKKPDEKDDAPDYSKYEQPKVSDEDLGHATPDAPRTDLPPGIARDLSNVPPGLRGQYTPEALARSRKFSEPTPGGEVPLTGGVIANQGPSPEKEQEHEIARATDEGKEMDRQDLLKKMAKDSAAARGDNPDPFNIRGGLSQEDYDAKKAQDAAPLPGEPTAAQLAASQPTPQQKVVAANLRAKGLHALANKLDGGVGAPDASWNESRNGDPTGQANPPAADDKPAAPQAPSPWAQRQAEMNTDQDRLRAAQQQANDNQWRVGMMMMFGASPDRIKAVQDQINAPVKNVQDQMDVKKLQLANSLEEDKAHRTADMMDPNSRISKLTQALGIKYGLSPDDAKMFTGADSDLLDKYGTEQEKRDGFAERAQEKKDELARQRDQDAETKRHNIAEESIARGKSNAKGGGRELPATETDQLSAIKTGADELNAINTKQGGAGALSAVWSKVPFTQDNVWQANRDATVDSTAAALTGGKRPSAPLIKKVDESFPRIGDSEEVKQKKLKNLQRMFATAHNNKLRSWAGAGYDISGFSPMEGEEGAEQSSTVRVTIPGGPTGNIPRASLPQFLKDHPGAQANG